MLTIENIYREAAVFAKDAQSSEDYNALAEENGKVIRPANGLTKGAENIPGLNQNRQIVKWAFDEDRTEKEITVFSTNDAHIVIILKNIFEEGIAPFEKVKEDVKIATIKEKKADILVKKFNDANTSGATMEQIATAVESQVKPQATNLNSTALSGVGSEPKVIGTMVGIETGKISAPIVGSSGVFVVMVQEELGFSPKPDYTAEKDQLESSVRGLVASQLFTSLQESADIEDFHNDIY